MRFCINFHGRINAWNARSSVRDSKMVLVRKKGGNDIINE